jgi:hypothetical protein
MLASNLHVRFYWMENIFLWSFLKVTRMNQLTLWLTDWLTTQLTNQPTTLIEQDPSSEAGSSSATQEIPHILWNLKFHYHAQKSLSIFPNLSHLIGPQFSYQTSFQL